VGRRAKIGACKLLLLAQVCPAFGEATLYKGIYFLEKILIRIEQASNLHQRREGFCKAGTAK
jgi:hypothetical protein